MTNKNSAIALIKYAIKTLEHPVQYSADVSDHRELTNRIAILRADAALAKRNLEKSLELFEIKE